MPKKINSFNKRKRSERNRLIFIISAVAVVCIVLIIAIILWNPSDQANNSSLDSSSFEGRERAGNPAGHYGGFTGFLHPDHGSRRGLEAGIGEPDSPASG